MTDLLRSVGLSRYELNARLKPALLALLPPLVVALFWYPGAWSIIGSIVAAASACGVLYSIALLARNRGRTAERKLDREVGRNHTARLLTHADGTVLPETKARYHAYLRAHDRVLSTPEEEAAEPDAAFRRARSAVDWLLEHTRTGGGGALLLDENISYGFQRNLFGLKPFGLGLSALALVVHILLLALAVHEEEHFWVGAAVCIPLAAFLFGWLFLVTEGAVAEASLAYAQRLLANCESVTMAPRQRRMSTGASKSAREPQKRKEASEP